MKLWSGELFSQSCRLALNLLDKHEIIDYFKKNKYLLANRFRESLEIAPEVAEKFASHDELLVLLKEMGFKLKSIHENASRTETDLKGDINVS